MTRISQFFALGTAAVALAGCGDGTANDTYEARATELDLFSEEVQYYLLDEGITWGPDLMTTGVVGYSGMAFAESHDAESDELLYTARIEVDVDYDNDPITGRVYDFKTTMPGLESPDGELEINGYVNSLAGNATWAFQSSGTLTQGDVAAHVYGEDGSFTYFVGDDPVALISEHSEHWEFEGGEWDGVDGFLTANWLMTRDD